MGTQLQVQLARWYIKSLLRKMPSHVLKRKESCIGSTFAYPGSGHREIHSDLPSAQANFGVCFDIDGVLARGYMPIPGASRSCQKLQGSKAKTQVPLAFVTNAVSSNAYKAGKLREMLGIEVSTSQMVQAQSPLELYSQFHVQHTLLIGQGALRNIAEEVGFKNVCTIEDVAAAYPLLDVADHEKRVKVAHSNVKETDFPPVQAILVLGEPKLWESCLQLTLDLLLTEGHPHDGAPRYNDQTIQVLACNMDLKYSHRASFDRIANGAFLLCLEELFKKFTGKDLTYAALMGKPSVVTFRYAEHCISRQARKLGASNPIRTLYMIGDNQQVDIAGANLYQNYINTLMSSDGGVKSISIPDDTLLPQTVTSIQGILVKTGVYNQSNINTDLSHQSHRDFCLTPDMFEPTIVLENVEEAVDYIITREHCL